ncbi:MAG: helix-turn-helix transcriptional regulator [Eubacteriales bacterium]|nr:helix-turn-helix transcriptional regulator [Eubacteriales bacterium]
MSEARANEICNKLKEARQKAGMTQEQLADRIMVSRVTVSHWENGRSLPDIASLITLSDLYQISLDELVKGDPKMKDKIVQDAKNQAALKRTIMIMLIATLIIAGIHFVSLIVGGGFKDFWQAAMPYILIAIYLALFFAYEGQKAEDKGDSQPDQNSEG